MGRDGVYPRPWPVRVPRRRYIGERVEPPIHWFMDSRPSFYASPSLHHSPGPFISHHSGLIQTPVQVFLVTASTAALHMRVRADAVCLLVSHIEESRGWVLSTQILAWPAPANLVTKVIPRQYFKVLNLAKTTIDFPIGRGQGSNCSKGSEVLWDDKMFQSG